MSTAAIQGRFELLTYADLADVNLIYARPSETGGTHPDLERLHHELTFYDNLLYLHYHSRNSKFFDQTAEQQERFLTKVIDSVSDSLPSPEFGDPAVCEEVVVPYVYRYNRLSQGTQHWDRIRSSDGEPLMLAGNVEGVSILEALSVASGKPLRSEDELVDAEASICIVLSVEQSSIPDVFGGQPVYVPLRLADRIVIVTP